MTRTYTVKQEYLVKILEYFLFLHKTCPRRGFSYGRVEKIILKLLNTQPALVARSDSHQEIQGFDTPVLATLRLIIKKFFYSHSFPSADSRRAFVSFWQKNVHKY